MEKYIRYFLLPSGKEDSYFNVSLSSQKEKKSSGRDSHMIPILLALYFLIAVINGKQNWSLSYSFFQTVRWARSTFHSLPSLDHDKDAVYKKKTEQLSSFRSSTVITGQQPTNSLLLFFGNKS